MIRILNYAGVLLCVSILVRGQNTRRVEPPRAPALQFTVKMLDSAIDPCTDFYAYACGQWKVQNPIPADQASWGRFNELTERGEHIIRAILEKYSADDRSRSHPEQKIGDYYQSCMDENAIETAGTQPLESELNRIASLPSKDALATEAVQLHRLKIDVLFSFGSDQDFKDATRVIAEVDEGGMALPDRDFYLRADRQSGKLRKQYLAHIQRMFELLGDKRENAIAQASKVLKIETALAQGALDRVSRRDPEKLYHKSSVQELAALHPDFGWTVYLEKFGLPAASLINVTEPEFFKALNRALRSIPLDDWKTYLRWHVLHGNANMLPARFVTETFDFFDRTLAGTRELAPRWKRCVHYTEDDLGEAVGEKYVGLTFGAEGKARTLGMVQDLEAALATDLEHLSWMSSETKRSAREKLDAIGNRIAYPDKWRDYEGFEVVRGDALGNSLRANQFEFQRQVDKIGRPVDNNEWPYPPSTVDASYNSQLNNITFPAGILQPPFFDTGADDAINFGAIGAVIGHELTHGFDDQGSRFDARGNMRDWWGESDKQQFDQRTKCVVDQYSNYPAIDGVKLNGKLTLGENVADHGGLRIAYLALARALSGKASPPIDGLTAEQRFFLGWANAWCQKRTDELSRMLATVDPHSPGKWRVNGPLSNMPEFQKAFHCKPTAAMVRPHVCTVW